MSADPSTGGVDYSAVLADLEAKKTQIENAIAVIRGMTGLAAVTSAPTGDNPGRPAMASSGEIAMDAFFGLSIPDAAKKFLGLRKRPATTPEIIEALRTGGQQNAAGESFSVTVGSVLNRAYANGAGIVRVSRGTWGLAEWYPNKPRKPPQKGGGSASEVDLD